jgi:sulfur carrier protein
MSLTVNGRFAIETAQTIADLLRARGVDPAALGIAVAVNRAVVRRGLWETTILAPGDAVEIVRPLQGG